MPAQRAQQSPGGDVPHLDQEIVRAGEDARVGAIERDAVDIVRVPGGAKPRAERTPLQQAAARTGHRAFDGGRCGAPAAAAQKRRGARRAELAERERAN